MPDLLKGNRDSLPDHMTPDGDPVAWAYDVEAIAEDGTTVLCGLKVRIHASNALSVVGHIGDRDFALAMLDHAEDALRGYHKQRDRLMIPGKDTSLGTPVKGVRVSGPVEDKLYAIACMQQAKAAIIDMHDRRKVLGGRNRVEL